MTANFDFSKKQEVLCIRDFGAVGDGKTLCTAAIQQAIDLCPAGGEVLIPEGSFVSGALFLKSKMTLRLAKGARLLASTDTKDFPLMTYRFEGREQLCYASLINTSGAPMEDITIAGDGTIHGGGMPLYTAERAENLGKRGRAVCIRNTNGLTIRGVTIRQSPAWCLHLIYCEDIKIEDVKVFTKYDEDGSLCDMFNGDGIDIDSCARVQIRDCLIGSEDDCIAIKSGRDVEGRRAGIPSKDILIENCRFISGFGVAIGSEMSGGVENVTVRDCVFENTFSVASIKPIRPRGGYVRNITYERCTHKNMSLEHEDCLWYRGAIYMDAFYAQEEFDPDTHRPIDEKTPTVENIAFKDIDSETIAGRGVFLVGAPECPFKGVRFENVRVKGIKEPLIKNLSDAVMIHTEFNT
jgi:polygalacturonase